MCTQISSRLKKVLLFTVILFSVSIFFVVADARADWITDLQEDTINNPVYDPPSGDEASYPTVSYDENRFSSHGDLHYYKMWYDAGSAVGYAYSDDGINWTEVGHVSGLNAVAGHPVVVYDESGFGTGTYFYRIWYWIGTPTTNISAIRTAVSTDGQNWVADAVIQQHPTDASLQLVNGNSNGYFYHLYGPGFVIYNSSGTNTGALTPTDKSDDVPMSYNYVMYYDLGDGTQTPNVDEFEALAYSVDGIYWIRYGSTPVLLPSGNPSQWDGMYTFRPTIVQIGGVYHMWYSGSDGTSGTYGCQQGRYYARGVGHATSTDGINWTKDSSNPFKHVCDGVAYRNERSYTPWVLYSPTFFDGHGGHSHFKGWFTALDTATDNRRVAYLGNNVFDPPSGWKTVNESGEEELVWKQVWINGGAVLAMDVQVIDEIPDGTSYVSGSLQCIARGSSSTNKCEYDSNNDQVIWEGDMGPDFGASDEDEADNEVVIIFNTSVESGVSEVENQSSAYWDEDGDGSVDDDISGGQERALSDDPGTSLSDDSTRWSGDLAGTGSRNIVVLFGVGLTVLITAAGAILKNKYFAR